MNNKPLVYLSMVLPIDYLSSLVKYIPILAFVIYTNIIATNDWSSGFIIGGILAIIQLVFFTIKSKMINRIIIGADIYLIIAGLAAASKWGYLLLILNNLRETGLLLCIFLVGIYTTAFSRAGFIGTDNYERPEKTKSYSIILLCISAIAVGISFVFRNNRVIAIILPIIIIASADKALLKKITTEGVSMWELISSYPSTLMKFIPIAGYLICVYSPYIHNKALGFIIGGILAVTQLIFFALESKPLNRIIIGIDIYLMIMGFAMLSKSIYLLKILGSLDGASLLLCILLVGIFATMFSRSGFVGSDNYEQPEKIRLHSIILLCLVAVAAALSFAFSGNYRFTVIVPMIIICIANMNLLKDIELRK